MAAVNEASSVKGIADETLEIAKETGVRSMIAERRVNDWTQWDAFTTYM
jgi:hypothetical protein